jgi:glycerol-3-phosphate acyltransferase PlsY
MGSISSAILVCRLARLPDPRTTGSQNPGVTNVLRIGGKKAAFATLLGDVLKGMIPVFIAMKTHPSVVLVGPAMVAAVLGHLYPIFFNFRGGKGVATAIGVIFAFSWPVGLMFVATWGVSAKLFHISSLAALGAAFLLPFYTAWWVDVPFAIPMAIISSLLFWRHRSNIKRLWEKTEPKIGQKTK